MEKYKNHIPQIGSDVFLHASAQIIGDVIIGDNSSVWCQAVLRGDVNRIVIGHSTNIQDLTMGHVSHKTPTKPQGSPLLIGDYVTVGHSVILHGCQIGDDCLIGMGSIIMDDVIINDQVMVGAGSLVSPGKILQSGMLYMGRPAKAIRPLNDDELDYLRYSAEHYVRVKNSYIQNT